MSIQPTPVIPLKDREKIGDPFARLGYRFQNVSNLPAVDTAENAGMDFEVKKLQLGAMIKDDDGIVTDVVPTPSYGVYSNQFGQWKYLNTAKKGEKLELVQNMDIAKVLDAGDGEISVPLTKQFKMYSAGVIGKYSFFCLEMGKDSVKLGSGKYDEYNTFAVVGNDYTNFMTYWSIGTIAAICLNTLLANLSQSAADGSLWRISHRSNPMGVLKYRAELEHKLQESRQSFYTNLERWAGYNWNEEEKDVFVHAIFPFPAFPKSMKRAEFADQVSPEVAVPVVAKAKDDKKVYESRIELAQANRLALDERMEYWAGYFGQDNLYTGYAAATDVISWRHERGSMEDLAEAVLFNTRRQEMDRMMKVGNQILLGNFNN